MPSRNSAARWLALAGLAMLAACATDRPQRGGRAVSDTPVKIGSPYRAGGRIWVPADDRGYDVVGYASWYGGAHAGRPTASGERFDPRGISAAHPTLPLPSYVEVTALDSGRTILARVNDRGPFVASRIIDLSAGAARALGIERQGVARVRVRRVQPPEADRAALRAGRPARTRPDASRQVLAGLTGRPGGGEAVARNTAAGATRGAMTMLSAQARMATRDGVAGGTAGFAKTVVAAGPAEVGAMRAIPAGQAPVMAPIETMERNRARGAGVAVAVADTTPPASPVSSGAPFYVHVATLDDADRADGLAGSLAAIGPATATAAGSHWQVRLGPYANAGSARSALARVQRAGYQEARVVRDSAQRQEDR